MSSKKKKNSIDKTFQQKKAFHKDLVNISFEEKLERLVQLQRLGLEIKRSTNKEIKPYETVWIL